MNRRGTKEKKRRKRLTYPRSRTQVEPNPRYIPLRPPFFQISRATAQVLFCRLEAASSCSRILISSIGDVITLCAHTART